MEGVSVMVGVAVSGGVRVPVGVKVEVIMGVQVSVAARFMLKKLGVGVAVLVDQGSQVKVLVGVANKSTVLVGVGERAGERTGVGVPETEAWGETRGDGETFWAWTRAPKSKNPRLTQDINLNVLAAELNGFFISVETKVNAVSFNGPAHISRDGVAVAFHIKRRL